MSVKEYLKAGRVVKFDGGTGGLLFKHPADGALCVLMRNGWDEISIAEGRVTEVWSYDGEKFPKSDNIWRANFNPCNATRVWAKPTKVKVTIGNREGYISKESAEEFKRMFLD